MSQTPEHAIRDWLANFQGTWYRPGTEPSRMLPETQVRASGLIGDEEITG
jgi:hypothetical protein